MTTRRLFKELATLRIDRSLLGQVDDLRWRGPTDDFARVCAAMDAPGIAAAGRSAGRRAVRLAYPVVATVGTVPENESRRR